MTIPPISTVTLTANPQFAALHEYLVKHKLNADPTDTAQDVPVSPVGLGLLGGPALKSTLTSAAEDSKSADSRHEVEAQLQQARIRNAQRHLLLHLLRSVTHADFQRTEPVRASDSDPKQSKQHPSQTQTRDLTSTASAPAHPSSASLSDELPGDAKQSIAIVSNYLSLSHSQGSTLRLPSDTEALLAEDINVFRAYLGTVCAVISAQIMDAERVLAEFAAEALPAANPLDTAAIMDSTLKEPAPQLLQTLHEVQYEYIATQALIPTLLTSTSTTLESLLTSHATQLLDQIRTLERRTFGTHARHALAKAGLLGVVAEGIECKAGIARLVGLREVLGDEDNVARMATVGKEVEREEAELERREGDLKGLLGKYEEEGGDGVFSKLGERYKEIEGEIEKVRGDVRMLEERIARDGVGRRGR